MSNNRIPRNAKKIYITWKVDTTGSKAGDRATVEKTERGWILTTESGKRFYMPLALLRNVDAVQVDQIEADEPNNRKDVLLSDIGTQVYIIDGASRTDKAAQAVIVALCNNGRITGELAERAKNDRPTLDKIKRNLLHVQMEERETETGMRWTFYTESGVYMDISAYSHNYIRADKHGNLYPTEAPTEPETIEGKEDTTAAETEPQRATETQKKTIQTGERLYSHPHRHMVTVEGLQGDLVRVIYKGRLYLVCSNDLYTDETETTPAQMENDTTSATEGTQEAPQTAGTIEGAETTTPPNTEPPRATERATGSVSQTDRRTRPAAPQSHETTKGHTTPPQTTENGIQSHTERRSRPPAKSRHQPRKSENLHFLGVM